MPYGSGTPPFRGQLGAQTYSEFFSDPVNASRYAREYHTAERGSRFQESQVPNWQAQHPPLYYLLMTPVLRASDHLSFVAQMFVLRLVSYLLAVAGVLFGLASISRLGTSREAAGLGFLFYPLLLPEFFPEFARIGNDALCLALLGCLLYLIAGESTLTERAKRPWLMGLVLGCGLLTKALFLPVTAAVVLWLVWCRWRSRTEPLANHIRAMSDIAVVLACASIVGGWWYVYQFLVFGAFTGGSEAVRLSESGGMLQGLQQNFSLTDFVRGLTTVPVTWVWTGTWSLARLPTWMHLPVVLLAFWVVAEFLHLVPRDHPTNLSWPTLLMSAGLCLGLVVRTLQGIALGNSSHSAGWYLHILMPWVAIAMGRGILSIVQRPGARAVFAFGTIFAIAFHLIAIWSHAALFSGCALKGDDKFFQFTTRGYCLDQASVVFERLSVVGWPGVAIGALAGALVSAVCVYHFARESWPARLPC
jgi:hypothetical protein